MSGGGRLLTGVEGGLRLDVLVGVAVGLTCAVAVVDYARFFEQRAQVVSAAWAGARQGAAESAAADRVGAARGVAFSVLGENGAPYSAHVAAAVWRDRDNTFVTVDVSVPFSDLLPILPKPGETRASTTWRVYGSGPVDRVSP